MLLKVDSYYSEQQHEKIVDKMRKSGVFKDKPMREKSTTHKVVAKTTTLMRQGEHDSSKNKSSGKYGRILTREDVSINSHKMSYIENEEMDLIIDGGSKKESSALDPERSLQKSSSATGSSGSRKLSRFNSVAADIRQSFKDIMRKKHISHRMKSVKSDRPGISILNEEEKVQNDDMFEELKEEKRMRQQSIKSHRTTITQDAIEYYKNYDKEN